MNPQKSAGGKPKATAMKRGGGNSLQKLMFETQRGFKVLSQSLTISDIDFEKQSCNGFTELTILPLKPDLDEICLNCGPQVGLDTVLVENAQVEFTRQDVQDAQIVAASPARYDDLETGEIRAPRKRHLKHLSENYFKRASDTDPEQGGGELKIQLGAFREVVQDMRALRVGIEFYLSEPTVGIQFFASADDTCTKEQKRAELKTEKAHQQTCFMFTYRSSAAGNSSRSWLPCVDAWSELCLWKIDVICDKHMTAICSGELQDTVYTPDMRKKTYHYLLRTPTSAVNIGLAVGTFETVVQAEMHELTSFCPPKLTPLLKHSTANLHKVIEFFEELLAARFPYNSYKQVFVPRAAEDMAAYSGLGIFSIGVLFHKKIIDPVPLNRSMMAHCIAHQFFGCFVTQMGWLDAWVARGAARYLTGLFMQKFFGNNEYLYHVNRTMQSVIDYENQWGPIVLRPLRSEDLAARNLHFDPRCADTCSAAYVDLLARKADLVFRMLEKRLGKELLFQVLNKVMMLAAQSSQQKLDPVLWQNLLLSTESFFKIVSNVTGQELPTFLEQWIYAGGHPEFSINYSFNRKRNSVELEINQNVNGKGKMKYTGPVSVAVQELDGCFSHTLQIDDVNAKHDIGCHSKSRKQKKRKITLWTSEEIDIDLTHTDQDSPVLWLRFDPELLLLRKVEISQPDYHWFLQLKHERDVLAQLGSLDVLPRFPTPQVRYSLLETIKDEHCFFRVRVQAAFTMAEVANKLQGQWMGPPAMLNLFRQYWGSDSAPHITKLNNFNNLQMYFLMQAIPTAMAMLRPSANMAGSAPGEVQRFLLDLLKYNDNSRNKFLDDHYRAGLLIALAQTVGSASAIGGARMGQERTIDRLSHDIEPVVEEIVLALNMEKVKPSYSMVVTVSCLRALLSLMKKGHLPLNADLFWPYSHSGQYQKVRCAAFDSLSDFASSFRDEKLFFDLLNTVTSEKDPGVRYHIAKALVAKPPFTTKTGTDPVSELRHPLNTIEMVDRLWNLIRETKDPKLRAAFMDLYCIMYGPRDQPEILREKPLEPAEPKPETFVGPVPRLERPDRPTSRASSSSESVRPVIKTPTPLLKAPISFVRAEPKTASATEILIKQEKSFENVKKESSGGLSDFEPMDMTALSDDEPCA